MQSASLAVSRPRAARRIRIPVSLATVPGRTHQFPGWWFTSRDASPAEGGFKELGGTAEHPHFQLRKEIAKCSFLTWRMTHG